MTINHFAKHIGLSRAENLYQIKNGNNGISQKLAHRIVEAFPAISIGWLLSGEGAMLCEDNESRAIPCFCDLEKFLSYCRGEHPTPDDVVCFPLAADADVVVVVDNGACVAEFCNADDVTEVKNSLFLKKIEVDEIIPSSYYMILFANFIYLRKVMAVTITDDGQSASLDCESKFGYRINLDAIKNDVNAVGVSSNVSIAFSDLVAIYKVVGVYSPMI